MRSQDDLAIFRIGPLTVPRNRGTNEGNDCPPTSHLTVDHCTRPRASALQTVVFHLLLPENAAFETVPSHSARRTPLPPCRSLDYQTAHSIQQEHFFARPPYWVLLKSLYRAGLLEIGTRQKLDRPARVILLPQVEADGANRPVPIDGRHPTLDHFARSLRGRHRHCAFLQCCLFILFEGDKSSLAQC